MRIKSKNITLLFVLLTYNLLNAQNYSDTCYLAALKNNKSAIITATQFINEHPSKKEQFTSKWVNGTIVFNNGTKAVHCKLRYNCWKDELIWLRESDYKMGTVIKGTVKAFVLNTNQQTITFIHYNNNERFIKQDAYLEVLVEGEISLYCRRKCTYIKSSDAFSNQHQYYLKINNEMLKTSIRKSSFKTLLGDQNFLELKKILKENHLRFKDEYKLAKAIQIFNSINE